MRALCVRFVKAIIPGLYPGMISVHGVWFGIEPIGRLGPVS